MRRKNAQARSNSLKRNTPLVVFWIDVRTVLVDLEAGDPIRENCLSFGYFCRSHRSQPYGYRIHPARFEQGESPGLLEARDRFQTDRSRVVWGDRVPVSRDSDCYFSYQ